MCGIFCRIKQNDNKIVCDVITGLKRLAHRGYESWGIYCFNGTKLSTNHLIKQIGDIVDLDINKDLLKEDFRGCMAHTRWATHGEVSKVNTHPIASRDCKVHVVHNGIIENALALKSEYSINTVGETDTEVFANIVAIHLKNGDYSDDPLKELAKIANFIEGDNAFVIHYQHDDWKKSLFAFTTGNGILYANDGYISSEINALAGFVKKAKQLKNDRVYVINRYGSVLNNSNVDEEQYIDVPDKSIVMNTDQPMLSEIKEQADYGKIKFPFLVSSIDFKMDKIILTGCGSSYYAGMFGQRCFEQVAGIEAQTKYASEFMHCSRQYNTRDYHYICLSQSGETKDTLDAIAPLLYDRTVTITNNEHCTMKRYAKYNIDLNVGLETGVAATKTFFGTCFTLAQMAIQQTNNTAKEYGAGQGHDLYNFTEYIKDTIEKADEWAKDYAAVNWTRYLFLGSGLTYPIALEAALKMKEVAYLSAEGMPASEIKHGPIALIDKDTLSVFILSETNKSNMKSILSNIEEIRSRHGQVLIICDSYTRQNYDLQGHLKRNPYVFSLPEIRSTYGCEHIMSSLACIIPLQLLAYYTAIREGHNPNRPRNLCKTVTI